MLKRIEIEAYGRPESGLKLTDEEAVSAFARACADAGSYSPNHPSYDRQWYLLLSGESRMELELYLEPRSPDVVFGAFVEKSGSTTWYHGNFQSRALRSWVKRYLETGK